MFDQFTVKKFRCFGELHLENLARVNLIAGENNTGKTALLEAIHLHNNPNNCELPLLINRLRGVSEPGKAFEDVLDWLFLDKHGESGLEISSIDTKRISRTLGVSLLDAATARERIADAEKLGVQQSRPENWGIGSPTLLLRYEQTDEPPKISFGCASHPGDGTSASIARLTWRIPSIFLASAVPRTELDVKHFGEMESAKRQGELLPSLKILENRLEKLALIPLAGELVIHGDIGRPRMVPVPFMGEGLRGLLSIVLAMVNAPGGVVLIDEIENGLHYSVMKDVWKAIGEAARQADVQVFATTHSYECIQAAHEAFSRSDADDLRLLRLDRANGDITVVAYDREVLEYALEMTHEVR